MEKPSRGLVVWGGWGSSLVDESGSPPLKRWVVHGVEDLVVEKVDADEGPVAYGLLGLPALGWVL